MDYTNHWKKQIEPEVIPQRNYKKYLKACVIAGILGIIAGKIIWNIITIDPCVTYYHQLPCMPPPQWKQVIKTDKHLTPKVGTGAYIQQANGLTQ